MLDDLFLLSMIGLLVWYVWDTIRSKEIARQAGQQACAEAQVQFLDQTVEHRKLWFCRDERKKLQLCRLYIFEFTRFGGERYHGRVVLLGKRVFEVEMDAYKI